MKSSAGNLVASVLNMLNNRFNTEGDKKAKCRTYIYIYVRAVQAMSVGLYCEEMNEYMNEGRPSYVF